MSTATPSAFMGFVHRRRRGAELFLLVLALVVGIGAYAVVGIGLDGAVPADILAYGGWLAGLAVVCHLVIRFTAPWADPVLLPVIVALNGLGLAMIHRIEHAKPRGYATASSQLIWMTLGVLLFIGVLLVIRDHRRLQAYTYTTGLLAIVLLVLPAVIGTEINGAKIWIRFAGFSFQPGEIAKLLLVVAFAGYLVQHRDALALAGRRVLFIDLPRGRDLGPILAMWAVSVFVLFRENDLGTALLYFGLFVVMLYVATERPGWVVIGAVLFLGAAFVAYRVVGHVRVRVEGWLDPFHHDGAFQLVQGLYGMAWGGLVGRGLGQGSPYLTPLSWSDFIIPSFGEELGLTGVMAIVLLYGLIVERALRTSLVCRDGFGKLLAAGLGAVFALQVFVVVGGVTRVIPLTGLTSPFLSAGGSSLVANWMLVALLLRVSDQARRPPPELLASSDDADQTQVVSLR